MLKSANQVLSFVYIWILLELYLFFGDIVFQLYAWVKNILELFNDQAYIFER